MCCCIAKPNVQYCSSRSDNNPGNSVLWSISKIFPLVYLQGTIFSFSIEKMTKQKMCLIPPPLPQHTFFPPICMCFPFSLHLSLSIVSLFQFFLHYPPFRHVNFSNIKTLAEVDVPPACILPVNRELEFIQHMSGLKATDLAVIFDFCQTIIFPSEMEFTVVSSTSCFTRHMT